MKKQCSNCIHWQGDKWRKGAECVELTGYPESRMEILEFPGGPDLTKKYGNLTIDTKHDFCCSHWKGSSNE